jgi:molybdate transport system substrate-binding protein
VGAHREDLGRAAGQVTLRLVSAGAAQGLVEAIAREHGIAVSGSFGAVGAMQEKLDAGEPADIVILTRRQVDQLAGESRVLAQTVADLGRVATAIGVRFTDASPDVSTESALRAALLAADAVYFPDPAKATAGVHFAKVLDRLGIRGPLDARLRPHSNGATAMRAMAAAAGHPIGCTQATEILATPGVRLVAPLPPGCELETVYTAAVHAQAADRAAAEAFVRRLSGTSSSGQRVAAGFA